MASGFGRITSSGYGYGTNSTGAKISGILSQSVNSTNRTVTVTLRATMAFYRISGGYWDVSPGSTIVTSSYGGNYFTSTVGDKSKTEYNNLGIAGNASFRAEQGGTYSLLDGYVRAYYDPSPYAPTYYAEVTASKTYSYNDAGSAITDSWSSILYYNEAQYGHGWQEIKVSGEFTTDSIPPKHSAPTGVSASVSPGRTSELSGALDNFSVNKWNDTGSGTRYYSVANSSKLIVGEWSTTTPVEFTIPVAYMSTDPSTKTYSVYAAAKNYNGDVGYSGLYYITSPSAPTLTFTGSASTSPTCIPKAVISYTGGTANSTSADTAAMTRWYLTYKKSSDDSYPAAKQTSTQTGKTADDFDSISDDFEAGNNYNVRVRAVNTYGGTSEGTSTLYCPTGVTASRVDATVPLQLTFTLKANAAGTAGSSTGGTMACYQVSYVELNSQGQEVGSWVTSPKQAATSAGTATYLANSGLKPLTTYKYRVQGWNSLGLSSISGDATVTTAPKFYPEFDGKLTFGPQSGGNGVIVSGKILHPGGDTIDGSRVTTLYLYMRQKGTTDWGNYVTKLTNKSIRAGGTFSFDAVGDAKFLSYGDYEFYAMAINALGDSGDSQISELSAPSGVYITATYDPTQITMIAATGSTEGTNAKTWTLNYKTGTGAVETTTITSATQTADISSHNHLLFDTTYQVWIVVTNAFGLKQESAKINVTIPKRFSYEYVKANGQAVEVTASVKPVQTSNVAIADIYTVVKDALGNLGVGANLKNKRLVFPADMLHYRPENVADITLSNNRKIAYKLDTSANTYKFGIWNGNTIQTTFFDGTNWVPNQGHYYYDFGNTNLTITAISAKIGDTNNMNKSSAFSLTKCIDIPDWDRS